MPKVRVVKIQRRKGSKYSSLETEKPSRAKKSVKVMTRGTLRGIEHALHEWRKNSDKSARKRKDGAYKDVGTNTAKSTAILIRHLSWVPRDGLQHVSPNGRNVLRQLIARSILPVFK